MIMVLIDLPNRFIFNIVQIVNIVFFCSLVLMVDTTINLAACADIVIQNKQLYIYNLYF